MHSAPLSKTYKWHPHLRRLKDRPDWGFSFQWAVATCLAGTISWTISYALAFGVIVASYRGVEQAKEVMLVGLNPLGILLCLGGMLCLTFGFLISVAQWLILRKRPGWKGAMKVGWIVGGAVGWAFAFVPPLALAGSLSQECSMLLSFAVSGMFLGWIQWFSLRHYVRGPDMWMFANIVGLPLAWITGTLAFILFSNVQPLPALNFFDWNFVLLSTPLVALGLLSYGLVTGIALDKMERDTAVYKQATQALLRHRPRRPIIKHVNA